MKTLALITCIMLALLMGFRGCDDRSEDVKIIDSALYKTSKALKERYQLAEMGDNVSGIVGSPYIYEVIGLKFNSYRVLTKDEGRKMLVDCAETLLKEINSNQKLLPLLKPSPFSINNVEIAIYIYHPDRNFVYYPEISVFTIRSGTLSWRTEIPEKRFEYYTEEIESYEEAKKAIQSKGAK